MKHGDQHTAATPPLLGGLQISQDGYTLDLLTPRLAAGQETPLRFAIKDEAGEALTDYATAHDKDLHPIVASRDLNTFRHLHPALGADGTWSTPAELPAAGDYLVFADFTPRRAGRQGVRRHPKLTPPLPRPFVPHHSPGPAPRVS